MASILYNLIYKELRSRELEAVSEDERRCLEGLIRAGVLKRAGCRRTSL